MKRLFQKKSIQDLIHTNHEAHTPSGQELRRTLNGFNLTMIGVGAIVGAGIFSVTGTAAANYAGPSIVYSFLIAGALCAFAGLCYAELAAMIPVAGSAYTYSYATMGEFIAWIIGWDLILEYALGAVAVAIAWSGYAVSLVSKTLGIPLSEEILRFTKGPWDTLVLANGTQVPGIWNIPATLIALLISAVVYRGIRESAQLNNVVVVIKLFVIMAFVCLGWVVLDTAFWIANSGAIGFAKLVPLQEQTIRNGLTISSYGWPGVLTGAGVAFFSYIGFDMISTMAQECKKPAKDIPFGIIMSLIICTVLYIAVSLVMTGVVPYKELAVPDPLSMGIDRIVAKLGWSEGMKFGITFFVKFGALIGLTSGLLVCLMGQSRIFYAMSKDGLLPYFDRIHPKFGTPHYATLVTAFIVAALGGLAPIGLIGELVSIGTLLAFFLVCVGVPILRFTSPDVQRPFKAPFYLITSTLGAGSCIWVMSGLPRDTWARLFVWMAFGFLFYFAYGIRKSRLNAKA